MLKFTVWDRDDGPSGRRIHVDPAAVAAVEETTIRRSHGGACPVARIILLTGEEFTVCDEGRTAAQQIREGKVAGRATS